MAELLGSDYTFGGAVEQTYFDEGRLIERHVIDNGLLIEQNLQERLQGNNGFSNEGNLRKIAEIDVVTQLKLKTEFDIDMNRWNYQDKAKFKAWLRNPDNRAFRTYSGQI